VAQGCIWASALGLRRFVECGRFNLRHVVRRGVVEGMEIRFAARRGSDCDWCLERNLINGPPELENGPLL
jgi:hypothetical protein